MAETLLHLEIAEKRFADAPVLAGLTLTVAAGEVVALVGPSGCGKSTALMIAAGLDQDFQGSRVTAPDLTVAVQFQEPCLLPWRDLTTNVLLALPPAHRQVPVAADWLQQVGLPAASQDKFPAEVSLGMQRRAALARMLAAGGNLLLLDEPLVSLDVALAERLRALLLDWLARHPGAGMLLVTHDLEEAVQMADRVLLLDGQPARVLGECRPGGERGARTGAQLTTALDHIHGLHQQLTASAGPRI